MRHKAPRPLTNVRNRLLRTIARLLGDAARLRPRPAAVALMVVLSVGTAAYAALASVTGGSSHSPSAGSTASRDDAMQNESRDAERPTPTDTLPRSDGPTPSAASSAPSTPVARQSTARRGTPSPSAPTSASASTTGTPKDNAAPDTSLSAQHPAGDAATFSFSSDEPASFTCSLDGAAYTPCDSPVSYSGLASGWHTFAVRATDAAGNVDPSPAATRWHAEGSSADE